MHFIKSRFLIADKLVSIPINMSLDAIGKSLTSISNGIESLKFDEKRWRYYNPDGTKNKDANLLFFDPAVFEASDEKAQKKAPKMIFSYALKEVNSLEKGFYQQVNIARSNHTDLKYFDSFLRTALSQLHRAVDPVKEFLSNPEDLLISITKNTLIALNAFVVGLINGIIDILKGIFDILALLCKAFAGARNGFREVVLNLGSYVVMFLEALENMVDTVTNLFSKENLKAFLLFFVELQKTLFALPIFLGMYVWNTGQSIHVDTLGYYSGYVIGMLVDIILSLFYSGGAKTVADVLKLLGEQFEALVTLGQKAVVVAGRGVIRSLDEIIAIFAKIRNGAKNIKPFSDEILEWLRKLLKSNKADDFFDFIKKLQKGAGDINKTFAENAGIKIEKWLTEVKVIGQTTDHTCAATSLRMILEDKGIIKLEDELARALKTDVDGASILDIPEALYFKRLEDQVEAVVEGNIKLQNLIEKLKEGDIAIVSIGTDEFGNHAVVLEKIENGKVFLRDPLPKNKGAKYSMKIEDFDKIFNDKAVIIKK